MHGHTLQPFYLLHCAAFNYFGCEKFQATVPNNFSGAMKPAMDQGGNLVNSCGENGISELELMIKQKTFTRSEIDHLTELLRSRVVDSPTRDEAKWTETNHQRHEGLTSNPAQENRNVGEKFHEIVSTPIVSSIVVEEDVALPAEVAKGYMGSRRPSKGSPSMLGVPTQTSSKSPITSLVGRKYNPFGSIWNPNNSTIFGSCINPPSTGFSFGGSSSSSVATTNATPTLFGLATSASLGGQLSHPVLPPKIVSPFQASSCLDFNSGGSFSSDSDGHMSSRKSARVKTRNRKKFVMRRKMLYTQTVL